MSDVVEIIKAQHRRMDALLEEAMEEGSDTLALLRQVADLLLPHSQAEESYVYPSVQQHSPEEGEEVKDGAAEHHHIEATLQELLDADPDGPGYDGKLAGLVGELRHHVEEEEEELLPVLTDEASDDERAELGARFVADTRWEGPSAPAEDQTRDELYEQAKQRDVPGRSGMTKDQLAKALDED